MLTPMSANTASGGCPGGALPGFSRRGETSQMPERSGLPSAVRGAGALRFTLPSAPCGTPGSARLGHCAETEGERTVAMATTTANMKHRFISASTTLSTILDDGREFYPARGVFSALSESYEAIHIGRRGRRSRHPHVNAGVSADRGA